MTTLMEHRTHVRTVQAYYRPRRMRGCTVKLILRSKRTNDFGGKGYCVPGA